MGGETKKYVETVVSNSVDLQIKIKQVNETILNQTSNIMTKHMQDTAQGASIDQVIDLGNLVAGGDLTIADVSQEGQIELNLSALMDTTLQADMIDKVNSSLSTQLKESVAAKQSSGSDQGEQLGAIIGEVINKVMESLSSAMGADLDETQKTTIKNELKSYSETETINKIESAVESNINQETLNKIGTALESKQNFKIKSAVAGGDITIARISQKAILKSMADIMSKNGVGAGIISDMTGISETVVEKAVTADQTASEKKQGTIQAVGDSIASVFEGAGSGVAASGIFGVVSVSVLVIGAVAFMAMQGQKGGGLGFKMPKLNRNTQILLIVAVGVLLALNIRENFSKTENVVLKHGTRYLYPNGDKLCLTSDKQLAGKFNIQVITKENEKDIVLLKIDDKYLRKEDSNLKLVDFENFDKELHDFNLNKLSDISFELFRKDENIEITKDNCLALSKKVKEPFKILLE